MDLIVVPQWYREARQNGATRESLHEQVEEFCLSALKRTAKRRGNPAPESVAPEVVQNTVDMYEFALTSGKGDGQ